MSKKLHTVILQEKEIDRLKKRNRELERGHRSIWLENKRLRSRIRKLERVGNELSKVNI